VGVYTEDIYTPYGHEEVKRRFNAWKETKGKGFKFLGHSDNSITIKWKTLHFIITLIPDHVRIEAWVGDGVKYAISNKAFVGGIARLQGWRIYETLRDVFKENVEDGSLV